MDELDISGKQYISTRRAGKEHGYHSDYIGQLIRGGKVTGQKVGRAWYVDAESLATYLGKAYDVPVQKPAQEVAKTLDTISHQAPTTAPAVAEPIVAVVAAAPTVESKVIEPAVAPVVAKKEEIAPIIQERAVPIQVERPVEFVASSKEEKTLTPSGLVYIADDAPSLPQVQVMRTQGEVPMAQAAVEFAPQRRRSILTGIVVASFAAAVLVLGAGAGMYLSSMVQVAGETASVYYAIGK